MVTSRSRNWLFGFCLLFICGSLPAAVDVFEFSSAQLQARFHSLTSELRCPKCLNQNLADSDSPISADLRREIYLMLEEGKSDTEIKEFLVARYGVFVLYNPPLAGTTLWVWLLPLLLAMGGIALVGRVVVQASKRPIDDFNEGETRE